MITVLASVWEKTGLVELLKTLSKKDTLNIIATSSTAAFIKENGFECQEVSELTGFPEILNGRVKTLNPKVFGGILAKDTEEHLNTIAEHGIPKIDVVIVNLYPFAEMAAKQLPQSDLVEYVDIGGVALIRAAAKNFERVAVLCDPADYAAFAAAAINDNAVYAELAQKAFKTTAAYDALISQRLFAEAEATQNNLPSVLNVNAVQAETLRYGENPQNAAAWYTPNGQWPVECLQGKALSYNNLLDLSCATNLLAEFETSQAACCIIKHGNPCGVALASNSLEAYQKAFAADSTSAFGGIIGLNQTVTKALAEAINQQFAEIVLAPAFDADALEVFAAKKNLRVVVIPPAFLEQPQLPQLRDVSPYGYLVEAIDANSEESCIQLDWVSQEKQQPTPELMSDCHFAWAVVKHLRSNAIAIVKNGVTLGLGMGQTSRIASTQIALSQAGNSASGAVVASDGFFPATDNIEALAQAGVAVVVQPGGSLKDNDVISKAQELGLAMALTHQRCFKH